MPDPIIIWGLGEMGGVFARGLLRRGHPIYPVVRDTDTAALAAVLPAPALMLVAVGEADIDTVLDSVPAPWRQRLGLLQNELLPRDWQSRGIDDPTVISVWFEKKRGQDVKVLIHSPIHGPAAALLAAGLEAIHIPTRVLPDVGALRYELVRKNLYILTTNIAGLVVGGTVQALWARHEALARAVAAEVLDIQERLVSTALPRERLIEGMLEAFAGDPAHQCMGRSAPARLARAIQYADGFRLAVPKLRAIQAQYC